MSIQQKVGVIFGFRIQDIFPKDKLNEISVLISEEIDFNQYKSLTYIHVSDTAENNIIIGFKSEANSTLTNPNSTLVFKPLITQLEQNLFLSELKTLVSNLKINFPFYSLDWILYSRQF